MSAATEQRVPQSLADEWDDLADRTGAEPFMRPGWFGPWWAAFGRGRMEIVTARRDGRLIGVAPVGVGRGVVRSASNWLSPWFRPLAEDDDALAELADRLLGVRATRLTLSFVRGDDPVLRTIRSSPRSGRYRFLTRVVERSPFVETTGSFEDYEAGLATKLRGEIRRRRRRLEDLGVVRIEVETGADRLESLLEEGFRVEAAGWKGTRKTAIGSRPETRRFYTDVARWAASRGWLRLAFLRVDAVAIAFDYCFEDGGHHYLDKTGFDPRWSRYAPGILLRHAMVERAFREGLATYEFLGKDEPWKLEWAREGRELTIVDGFAKSPLGVAQRVAEQYGRPVGSRARRAVLSVLRRR